MKWKTGIPPRHVNGQVILYILDALCIGDFITTQSNENEQWRDGYWKCWYCIKPKSGCIKDKLKEYAPYWAIIEEPE